MTNQEIIRMHLEKFLLDTQQKGNLSVWGLLGFCVGYYGSIDADTLEVAQQMQREGWVIA